MSDARNAEAIAVRDAALEVVRRTGKPQITFGKTPVKIPMAETAGLHIAQNTLFTPRPAPSGDVERVLAAAGRPPLPYTLDIWDGKAEVILHRVER